MICRLSPPGSLRSAPKLATAAPTGSHTPGSPVSPPLPFLGLRLPVSVAVREDLQLWFFEI